VRSGSRLQVKKKIEEEKKLNKAEGTKSAKGEGKRHPRRAAEKAKKATPLGQLDKSGDGLTKTMKEEKENYGSIDKVKSRDRS